MALIDSPGTMIVISTDLARYSRFPQAFMQVQSPPGTIWTWLTGAEIAKQLNHGIRNMQGEWVWLMADDHVFAPDTLMRLLAHDKDIVAPLVSTRNPPYVPVLYRTPTDGIFPIVNWDELPVTGGLIGHEAPYDDLHATTAGMLLSKRALDLIGDPWFEVGKFHSERLNEDLWLNVKAKKAGLTVHVDCEVQLWHLTTHAICPHHMADGSWGVSVEMGRLPDGKPYWIFLKVDRAVGMGGENDYTPA